MSKIKHIGNVIYKQAEIFLKEVNKAIILNKILNLQKQSAKLAKQARLLYRKL